MTGVGITIGGGVSTVSDKPSHDGRPQAQRPPPRDQPQTQLSRVTRQPARTAIHEGGATKEDDADPVPLQDAAPTTTASAPTTTATAPTASTTAPAPAPVGSNTESTATTTSPPVVESDSQSSPTPATPNEETKADDSATATETAEESVVANTPTDSNTATTDETTSVASTATSTEAKVEETPSPFEELDALVAASSLSEADEKLGIMLSLLESRRTTDPRWCSDVLWRAAQLAYLHAAKGQKSPQQKTVRRYKKPSCLLTLGL